MALRWLIWLFGSQLIASSHSLSLLVRLVNHQGEGLRPKKVDDRFNSMRSKASVDDSCRLRSRTGEMLSNLAVKKPVFSS